jgi:hypothetical protein
MTQNGKNIETSMFAELTFNARMLKLKGIACAKGLYSTNPKRMDGPAFPEETRYHHEIKRFFLKSAVNFWRY